MSISNVLERKIAWHIKQGDCLDVMHGMPENSIDSIITDPPAGISFMGSKWDSFGKGSHYGPEEKIRTDAKYGRNMPYQAYRGQTRTEISRSRDHFIRFMTSVMTEAYRLLKPGGHVLVWALPRTSHWTGTAVENAGFDIRDNLVHIFGSGFPKSMNVSKMIDKMQGNEGEIIGYKEVDVGMQSGHMHAGRPTQIEKRAVRAPTGDDAKTWEGWGTALKPSVEFWILARKPLSESSIVNNVLRWGTGGININATRVPVVGETITAGTPDSVRRGSFNEHEGYQRPWKKNDPELYAARLDAAIERANDLGRWPGNLLLSHAEDCRYIGTKWVKRNTGGAGKLWSHYRDDKLDKAGASVDIGDGDSYETIEEWECSPLCPVRIINKQSGEQKAGGSVSGNELSHTGQNGIYNSYGHVSNQPYVDTGGAARFFPTFHYFSKPSVSEREKGLEGSSKQRGGGMKGTQDQTLLTGSGNEHDPLRSNDHPTVKSVALMSWLCRLITPLNGTILDMFCGSGSTGVAALQNGFHFIGIDKEERYVEIARKRIVGNCPLFNMQENDS